MKFIFYCFGGLVFIFAFGCKPKEKAKDVFPSSESGPVGWIVYEGYVPLDKEVLLYQELSMLPDQTGGQGKYFLTETLVNGLERKSLSEASGDYSVLVGASPGELIIYLHNSGLAQGLKRNYPTPDGKRIRQETFRDSDLALRQNGDNVLIVLNKNSVPLTLESRFNLSKRTSKLFTVEGHFAHTGDSAVFLEMNTGERWAISKRGAYDEAIRGYYQLASKKFDGVYIKAIGYSIRQPDRKGKEIDALVLRKILQMSSSN